MSGYTMTFAYKGKMACHMTRQELLDAVMELALEVDRLRTENCRRSIAHISDLAAMKRETG